jgi:hypothetical protein
MKHALRIVLAVLAGMALTTRLVFAHGKPID